MVLTLCRRATLPSWRANRHEAARIGQRRAGINTRMPELPEVETIKEDLRELVAGSEIERARVLDASLVEQPSAEEFASWLEMSASQGRGGGPSTSSWSLAPETRWCFN